MPNIQGSVNQLLGTLSHGIRDFKRFRQEQRKASAQEDTAAAARDTATAAKDTATAVVKEGIKVTPAIPAAANQQRLTAGDQPDPHANAQDMINYADASFEDFKSGRAVYDDMGSKDGEFGEPSKVGELMERDRRAATGNEHMQVIGQQQVRQRRRFADYLSTLPASLGGTVGDLPKDMQREIAKNYSPRERKALMDQMDKEREAKKK